MVAPIIRRIDVAFASVPGLESGLPAYAALVARYERSGDRRARRLADLKEGIIDIAAAQYRAGVGFDVELVEFSDGAFDFLFDYTLERTVLVHGLSREMPPNSRDAPYHKGYPGRKGYDKGHAMAHAQGGREGGPNYFPQRPWVNRRLSAQGHLWRDIETWLASHAGVFAFVRMIYAPGASGDVPRQVEYGLVNGPRQFRAVVFPNT